ncbi:hypothetical protein J1605_015157 [Eschrichtius robustus]|uniref:Uncharacterized protein n=1 Tax=Eschrichtius robustus TaxID=9764 RepID=A0AB34G9R3_ESCRO|nr:hypothetical protein J1605_015157 [Eschrichtius robustus]
MWPFILDEVRQGTSLVVSGFPEGENGNHKASCDLGSEIPQQHLPLIPLVKAVTVTWQEFSPKYVMPTGGVCAAPGWGALGAMPAAGVSTPSLFAKVSGPHVRSDHQSPEPYSSSSQVVKPMGSGVSTWVQIQALDGKWYLHSVEETAK